MTPIKLYPSEKTHKTSAALGGVNIAIAIGLWLALPSESLAVAIVMAIAGVAMIAATARRYANPKPSFEADADGFRVLGGKKRDWSEFRGVAVQHSQAVFSIGPGSVVVKTGKSILGGGTRIKYTHLSAPVAQMVKEIDDYARHAKRKDDLIVAMAAIPAAPLVGQVAGNAGRRRSNPTPTAAVAPAMLASRLDQPAATRPITGEGPVKSVPSFGERMFGRRKVI
mgnify:CR=1 FL=1